MQTSDVQERPPTTEPPSNPAAEPGSGWRARLAGRWQSVEQFSARIWNQLVPSEAVRRGAARGILVVWLALGVVMGLQLRTSLGAPLDALIGLVLTFLLARLVMRTNPLSIWLLNRLSQLVGWMGVGVLTLLIGQLVSWSLPVPLVLAVVFTVLAAAATLGGSMVFIRRGGWGRSGPPAKIATAIAAVLSVALLAGLVGWLRAPGSDEHLLSLEGLGLVDAPLLELPDPGQPGSFAVTQTTYGNGSDRHRTEFADAVGWVSESVDGTDFFDGFEGVRAKLRRWYWGLGMDEMPLNGRVWYPQGEGPFPMVLMVHGNHNMDHYSDAGYGYLGELLASRGAIFVSVDQNFLNGHVFGGSRKENDARGWLLLEHLAAWREWNSDPENDFHGRVDLDRVVLMGHSRGGEAAAIAACFNRLRHYPDDAGVEFDYEFGIRGVLAIAPSDGQYRPSDSPTPLTDVNYLVLQGGHDGDVSSFAGDRQYDRVQLTPGSGKFKTSLYAYRANHGQFNTVWGRTDMSPPFAWLLNLRPLLTMEEQLQIGRTYISAFVESTVHEREEYRALFRDSRLGRQWLPQDLYLSRYQDDSFELLADFEEDVDLTTGSRSQMTLEAQDLTVWKEADVGLRWGGRRENKAAYLGWNVEQDEAATPTAPRFTLRFADSSPLLLAAGQRLTFDLAASDEEAPEPEEEAADAADDAANESDTEAEDAESDDSEDDSPPQPIDFTIELESRDGTRTRLRLAELRPLPPPLESRYSKLKSLEDEKYGKGAEVIFQTYELPLERMGLPGLDLAAVHLVFDLQPTGVVILDRLGVAGEPVSPSPSEPFPR